MRVNVQPSTLRRDQSIFKCHLRPAFGTTPIDQIAVRSGLLTQNPARGLALPQIPHKEPTFLNPAQVDRLASLRVGRVNIFGCTIGVVETRTLGPSGTPHFGPPKSRAGRSHLDLSDGITAGRDQLPLPYLAAGDGRRRPRRTPHPRTSPYVRRDVEPIASVPTGCRQVGRTLQSRPRARGLWRSLRRREPVGHGTPRCICHCGRPGERDPGRMRKQPPAYVFNASCSVLSCYLTLNIVTLST
jgi:hypothetical protein